MNSVNGDKPAYVHLEQIFKDIVEKNLNIKIELDTLNDLMVKDLHLNLNDLSDSHRAALPYMLVNYIKKWPGWDKKIEYDNGSLDTESWYKRFRHYVLYKMTFLVTKTLRNVESDLELEANEVKKVSCGTQLSNKASFANFNIDVAGPPSLLSNLVFWGFGDDISVEEHSNRQWIALDMVQLLNYPHVEVEFNSPELSFKRSFEPRITRYLSGGADMLYEKPNFILGKHRINSTTAKFTFPVTLLEEYIKLYKDTMFSQIDPSQRIEVEVILDEFYKDMLDIQIDNSVAENRQVTFNMGKNIFKRSKKISNDETDVVTGPSVIFNEVFLPKIVSSFRYFTGLQEYTLDGKRIVSTKRNGSVMMMNFKPMISYKCTFCRTNYSGANAHVKFMAHLESTHKREQQLLCLLCKNSFEVTKLAGSRWKCTCQK